MQDVPVECSIDATEIEQMACKPTEPVKPKPGDGTVTPQSGGGGTGNPPEPKPNPK